MFVAFVLSDEVLVEFFPDTIQEIVGNFLRCSGDTHTMKSEVPLKITDLTERKETTYLPKLVVIQERPLGGQISSNSIF